MFDDADFDRAVQDATEGGFYNKGEACTATSRILVQDGIYDRFVEQLAAAVRKLKVGRGTNPAVHVGPVVSRLQQKRVLNYIQIGIDEGATLTAQAPIPDDPELANGCWVAPTLFTDVTREMRIATEEIFGPVVAVIRFSDEDEAVAIANESEYGLTSAIYTADSTRGFRVARRIEVGMVFINNYFRGTGGHAVRRDQAFRLRARACDRHAARVQLHQDRPFPVGPRDDPGLACARRHLRQSKEAAAS